ncbi:four helix bundle protein [Deinococcus xianganensis]|uniref:Four helix bundle protein n=1 Tax=Deinococcus xianganensis TaxID=1507289 RepID=A0A6I4YVN3_9DEIO|nr:four helix bundle protein [Deinococcus xianganensis]MXV21173.1 four helix bundle protein [Deinococcus xianganensis]
MAEGRRQNSALSAAGFFPFEDLEVYHLSVEFAAGIYVLTRHLPAEERFGLTNQIRRAATSITLNIAEGRGRGTDRDFARFLTQARGSLYEVISGLHLSTRLEFIASTDTTQLNEQGRVLAAKLTALINKLGTT